MNDRLLYNKHQIQLQSSDADWRFIILKIKPTGIHHVFMVVTLQVKRRTCHHHSSRRRLPCVLLYPHHITSSRTGRSSFPTLRQRRHHPGKQVPFTTGPHLSNYGAVPLMGDFRTADASRPFLLPSSSSLSLKNREVVVPATPSKAPPPWQDECPSTTGPHSS